MTRRRRAEASLATLRLVDDGDRAGRVMQDCHAHRAKQHAAHPAPAAGAYDQQLGSGCRIQQRAPWRSLDKLAAHNHRGIVSLAFGKRKLEVRLQEARAASANANPTAGCEAPDPSAPTTMGRGT